MSESLAVLGAAGFVSSLTHDLQSLVQIAQPPRGGREKFPIVRFPGEVSAKPRRSFYKIM